MSSTSHSNPNILIIVLDCGRADRLSCYGYHRRTTPNIDAIASEGVLYRNAISPAEWTVPSHGSMFTGLMPSEHGAVNEHRYLDPGPKTLAESLSEVGYETISLANNAFLTPDTGLTRGFKTVDGRVTITRSKDLYHRSLRVLRRLRAVTSGDDDRGAWVLNQMIKRWMTSRSTTSPVFVFTNFVETHAPYHWLPKRYRRRYLSNRFTDEQIDRVVGYHYRDILAGTAEMSESDYEVLNAIYDSTLNYIDDRLGELFDFMRRRKLLDNTLLVITADHGDNLGDHGLVHHAYSLHDTLVHVPLIVRYPPMFPGGVAVDDLVQTLDIYPTILDILHLDEADVRARSVGESLLPSKLNQRQRRFAVSELTRPINEFANTHPHVDFTPFDRELRAVRTREWKYIWASDGRHELYYLPDDPGEVTNLYVSRPEIADELHRLMTGFWAQLTPAQWQGEAPALDDAISAHLEALGYIE